MTFSVRRIHRVLAVPLGIALVGWIVSGVVMILPAPTLDGLDSSAPAPVPYSAFTLPPAEAVARFRENAPTEASVTRIGLRRIRNDLVYEISTGQGSGLIHATTGEPFTIGPAEARQIAEAKMLSGTVATGATLIERHGGMYRFGPVPVYEVIFEGTGRTRAYVSPSNGDVRLANRWTTVRGLITSVHDLFVLQLMSVPDSWRRTLLLGVSLAALGLAATGYSLLLRPRSLRARSQPN